MRIPIRIDSICREEALRYLGWRGACDDQRVQQQLDDAQCSVLKLIRPAVVMQRFRLEENLGFEGSIFMPIGKDANRLLSGCCEAVMLAATLGMQSERLLLQEQLKSPAQALVLDAVLSAAIEQVCDDAVRMLEKELKEENAFLTRRFSPGYGDMPLMQSREICAVLNAEKEIGLTVSSNGTMIPRKSVTAIMGISCTQREEERTGCAGCPMNRTCNIKK